MLRSIFIENGVENNALYHLRFEGELFFICGCQTLINPSLPVKLNGIFLCNSAITICFWQGDVEAARCLFEESPSVVWSLGAAG